MSTDIYVYHKVDLGEVDELGAPTLTRFLLREVNFPAHVCQVVSCVGLESLVYRETGLLASDCIPRLEEGLARLRTLEQDDSSLTLRDRLSHLLRYCRQFPKASVGSG